MLLDRRGLAVDVTCAYRELGHLLESGRLETWAIDFSCTNTTFLTELCKADGKRNYYKCVGYFVWTQLHILVVSGDLLDSIVHLLLHGDKLLITRILCCPLYECHKAVKGCQCQLEVLLLPVQHTHLPPHHLSCLLQQNLFATVEHSLKLFK